MAARRRGRGWLHLPEELQEEILFRLPAKSIVKLECVCKTWQSKFRSQPFKDDFRRRGESKYESEAFHTIKLEDLYKMAPAVLADPDKKWRLVSAFGPLNGIYCLTSVRPRCFRSSYSLLRVKIGLCNPATHQLKFTGPFPREYHPKLRAISPRSWKLLCGFGRVGEDYRVVALINHGSVHNDKFLVFVYSFQRGAWERIVDYKQRIVDPTEVFKSRRSRGLCITSPLEACPRRFFNGCWHWMTTHRNATYTRSASVLSFNFAQQSFQFIGGPPRHMVFHPKNKADVLVLHDHLAAIYLLPYYAELDVWMMMDYGVEESWTNIYTINPNFVGHYTLLTPLTLRLIDYSEEGGGGIRIKRLLFTHDEWGRVADTWQKIVKTLAFDEDGHHQVTVAIQPSLNQISFSTGGISNYIETLERI